MPARDIVVIGASAGGLEPLREIVSSFPPAFPAAVLVVVHIAPESTSMLPAILRRSGTLHAEHCPDGAPLRPGRICIAPPDHHLIIRDGRIRLGRGPRENNCRPAVDVLFRSAALCCGPRVIGIVLSGSLDDGTAGLLAIKSRAGIVMAQDPASAMFPSMPTSAVSNVPLDYVGPPAELARALVELVRTPAPDITLPPPPPEWDDETRIAESAMPSEFSRERNHPGTPASFGCPECGGTLWEIRDGDRPRFRCRVGHAYSPETLAAEQGRAVEAALWVALRALEENRSLVSRMGRRIAPRNPKLAEAYRRRAAEAEEHARVLRRLLDQGEIGAAPSGDEETSAAGGNGQNTAVRHAPPPATGPAGQE
jgi:two-component system chemotaxis response regulator CheB